MHVQVSRVGGAGVGLGGGAFTVDGAGGLNFRLRYYLLIHLSRLRSTRPSVTEKLVL